MMSNPGLLTIAHSTRLIAAIILIRIIPRHRLMRLHDEQQTVASIMHNWHVHHADECHLSWSGRFDHGQQLRINAHFMWCARYGYQIADLAEAKRNRHVP